MMSAAMKKSDKEKHSPWWREPMVWLIMALPLTAVVAGLTTVWIAFSRPPNIVSDGNSGGMEVTKADEMDKRAYFLKISADAKASGGNLTLSLAGRISGRPQRLTMHVIPSSGSGTDNLLVMQENRAGEYSAAIPVLPAGPCQIVLEPENHQWRLSSFWRTPFTGSLHFAAKPLSDSSMLP